MQAYAIKIFKKMLFTLLREVHFHHDIFVQIANILFECEYLKPRFKYFV